MAGENIWSRNDLSPCDFNRVTLSGNQQGAFMTEAVNEIFVFCNSSHIMLISCFLFPVTVRTTFCEERIVAVVR